MASKESPAVLNAYSEFLTTWMADLANRLSSGAPLIVTLTKEPRLYRAKNAANQWSIVTQEQVLAPTGEWPVIADLGQLLQSHLERLSIIRELSDWGIATLLQLIPQAGKYADRLLTQLGLPGNHIGDATSCYWGGVGDACESLAASRRLTQECAKRLINDLLQAACSRPRKSSAAMLRLLPRAGRIRVEWLDARGRTVGLEGLRRWSKNLFMPALRELVTRARGLRDCRQQCENLVLATGRWQNARVERAVQISCQQKRPVVLRLASSQVRGGIPVSVWLEIDPRGANRGGSGACVLSVNRAHDEFVLEGPPPQHWHFYFPPCLLVARIVFSANEINVMNPLVRQPSGGYLFRHPYTGDLTSTGDDSLMMDYSEPAWYGASSAATAMFPELASRLSHPAERDICINNQAQLVDAIVERFVNRCDDNASSDVLGLVTDLHDLAKLGLTRAHQLNTQNPRATMDPTQMKYVVSRHGTGGRFESRMFPYDPRNALRC